MQKGFGLILMLIGIVIFAIIAIGIYYLGTKQNIIPLPFKKAPVACTQEAKQCPDGSFVGREGPSCEFSPCPTSSPNAASKIYTNSEFGYSVEYPPSFTYETLKDDTYLSLVSFSSANGGNENRFSIRVRQSTLEEEIKYQKRAIEGHILVKLTQEKQMTIDGFPGVLLEYTPDRPDIGPITRLAITNNGKYSFTLTGDSKTLDIILSTFQFIN